MTKNQFDALRSDPNATEREYPRDWEVMTEVFINGKLVASRTIRASGVTYKCISKN